MQGCAAGDQSNHGHALSRQLSLRDLVLTQVLAVVGSSWVGIAAGVGCTQFVVWLMAFALASIATILFQFMRSRISRCF
jgi:hypothetical protein